jgi:hypothetical protein
MRKIDKDKPSFGMAAKTVWLEKIVIDRLEEIARKEHTNVSKVVNNIIRSIVLTEVNYFREQMKFHSMKMYEAKYMLDQAEEREKDRLETTIQ